MWNRRSKYGAVKQIYDGHRFDSIKEMNRYKELKLLESAGEISDLHLQYRFTLIESQKGKIRNERPLTYVADFWYVKDGEVVVEDVKGMKTKEYIIKRKLMKYLLGIEVVEID